MKNKFKTHVETIKFAFKNFERLVEALALIVVAVYAVLEAQEESGALYYVLVVAGVIIGVRGSVEFLRHLAQK